MLDDRAAVFLGRLLVVFEIFYHNSTPAITSVVTGTRQSQCLDTWILLSAQPQASVVSGCRLICGIFLQKSSHPFPPQSHVLPEERSTRIVRLHCCASTHTHTYTLQSHVRPKSIVSSATKSATSVPFLTLWWWIVFRLKKAPVFCKNRQISLTRALDSS